MPLPPRAPTTPIWIDQPSAPDQHVLFRGTFHLDAAADLTIRAVGASWYVLWLDGFVLMDGPNRFTPAFPEWATRPAKLGPGKHVLAAHVTDVGVATRMVPQMSPFLLAEMFEGDRAINITWKATPLPGCAERVRRINPQLGWIEWRDTRAEPRDWKLPAFVDDAWQPASPAKTDLGPILPESIGAIHRIEHALVPIAQGNLAENFGYEADDPSARFFLRDLECKTLPPQGVWRRYDLGRVRLGRPSITLTAPAGAVVEFAQAEALRHGRVAPYITLSGGESCNLDHFIANGGEQTFEPLTPKGGRFFEVHVLAPPDQITFTEERFVERTYHNQTLGQLTTPDAALNNIWTMCVETYRACSEDAIIDNPTRERGQWVGDALIGGETASVAFNDLRLMRRGLVQTAQGARADGLVPGMTTGGLIFLASYSALWVPGCIRYVELTGDKSLLVDLFDAAKKNLAAFEPHVHPDGLHDDVGGVFIDWGFDRGQTPINIPLNLYYVRALAAMECWCALVDRSNEIDHFQRRRQQVEASIRNTLASLLPKGWAQVGYHAAALALAQGFVADAEAPACIAFLKSHLLNCFPNNLTAPRNSDPSVVSAQLITPYFAHFAFVPLIERGEMDFVLNQYRTCWGWMLDSGYTTCLEVFDPRWSHCHQWAGCPAWQMSRYLLGLHPRHDVAPDTFALKLRPGSLSHATGTIPLPHAGAVHIDWHQTADAITYALNPDRPITLIPETGEKLHVSSTQTLQLTHPHRAK